MKEKLIKLLRREVGRTTNSDDEYLEAIIDGAIWHLTKVVGLELDLANPAHCFLIARYGAFIFSKEEVMPKSLSAEIKDCMIGGKNGSI